MNVSASGTFKIGGDLEVRRLGFGAMRITGEGIWGPPDDHDRAIRVLEKVRELGIDFIDTADSYGPFVSEDLRQCALMSLRRLKVETIDLWQLHRIDGKVSPDAQFRVMKEMQDEGLVRHLGLSEVSVDEIKAAQEVFEVTTVQNLYNLANRQSEDVLEYCEEQNIGFIPWFPLNSGSLARPGGPVAEAAQRHDATPGKVALAWLLARSPVMLPIPGTGSVEHLEENAAAADLQLAPDELEAISAAAA